MTKFKMPFPKLTWSPQWYIYNEYGYRFAETKSIGPKWVRYRTSRYQDQYKRVKRSVWDKMVIEALEEYLQKRKRRK